MHLITRKRRAQCKGSNVELWGLIISEEAVARPAKVTNGMMLLTVERAKFPFFFSKVVH